MRSSIIDLYTAQNLPVNRCYDGLLLLWPINSTAEIQHSTHTDTVEDCICIINHSEVFQVKNNDKMMMLYIASDWFLEKGFAFFNYAFNAQLIQSNKHVEKAMLILLKKYLEGTLSEDNINQYVGEICYILINEASVELQHVSHHLLASLNNRDKKIVEYIHKHIDEKITLETVAKEIYTSPTSLSSHFQKIFNMGFRNYIETLRIGLSMELLVSTKMKISEISQKVGFSSFSVFSRKFKQHLETTPNDYRHKSKVSKNMCYIVKGHESELSNQGKQFYIEKVDELLSNWKEDKQNIVYIDNSDAFYKPTHPFVMTIQIHTLEELKQAMVKKRNKQIMEFDKEVMFLINISIPEIHQAFSDEELTALLDTMHNNQIRVAFTINSKDDIDYMKQALLQSEVFTGHPAYEALRSEGSNISFTFSLHNESLKDIYIQKMRLKELGFNVKFNLEISKLFNDLEKFKSLELPMKRVNFDYYIIDNEKLKYPYLEKSYQNIPMKQIANLAPLKAVMDQVHLEERKYILVNIPNRELFNENMSLLDSTPLMMYMYMQFYEVFSGIGVDLYKQTHKNAAYLFDRNGFKSTLYFLYQQLSDFETYYFYENEACLVSKDDERLSIIVYDWRIIENEVHETEQSSHRFDLGFKDVSLRKNYLVTREITDYQYGNINQIISPSLLNTYQWSEHLKEKIESVNVPNFDVFEHDFNQDFLSVEVNYNSLQVISLYKMKD
ncbi:helix-turn-helix domain-containing protein [Staphylococcus simulans]|uniref:helix-turn-helix domain-containing protein n=1 Tax=Staphylococcus simulans TaxID=1286 RepID=UPI003F7CE23C